MKSTERRLLVFDMLKMHKYVTVNELVYKFNVSAMTIRRDLAYLESQGVLITGYGGAVLKEGTSSELSFRLKSGISQQYKDQIAYQASKLVNNGDCIYIDCGTTALALVKYILNKEIVILTNSWKVLTAIDDFSKVKVILAPGEYDCNAGGVLSSTTIRFFKDYKVDKAFISTQGIDIDYGVSVPNDNDANVKRAIMESSIHRILLADHTKFGITFLAKHGSLSDFDVIFTDSDIDDEILNKMKLKKYDMVVCDKFSFPNN